MLLAVIFFAALFASAVFAVSYNAKNDNNSGWVNVPLGDSQYFEVKDCNYRITLGPDSTYGDSYLYATWVESTRIGRNSFGVTNPRHREFIFYDNKKVLTADSGDEPVKYHVRKIEKFCKLPDTAPPGMIGQFALAQCPVGWSTWLFAKATVECNTSNCKIAVCKKD